MAGSRCWHTAGEGHPASQGFSCEGLASPATWHKAWRTSPSLVYMEAVGEVTLGHGREMRLSHFGKGAVVGNNSFSISVSTWKISAEE